MRALKTLAGSVVALAMLVASPAHADEWNKKTFLTFSGPVQVPGVTLPAGTYTFKLADLSGNRHVVQIFDKDEKKIYTTILAIPDQRLEPSDKPVVLFAERPAGVPQAVKAWFYPGETIGNEFVYSKREAVAIAKATHQSVLAREDSSSDMKGAHVGRVNENGEMANAPTTTASAATTTAPAPVQTAPSHTAGTTGSARSELPRTASPLPLLMLLSALSIAGGFVVSRARRA